MAPATHFDRPGKSPFMDMQLVPVYADADTDAGHLAISPRIEQSLGLRTVEVVEDVLAPTVTAVGTLAFDERDQAVVQARAAGFVERVHVRATGEAVRAGAPLVELQVPEWIAAQEEFLAVRRLHGADLGPVVDAARQRMRQLGMGDALIATVESTGRPQARVTVTAPVSGVATEIGVREGMTVSSGQTLVRLNGLSTVWAEAQVPESQAAGVRVGAPVTATVAARPGRVFAGRVQALLPGVDTATRTLKARVALPNPGAALVPGMTVSMTFGADPGQGAARVAVVPTEAVIRTGTRTVVMLAGDGGSFRPVEVETGVESGGRIAVLRGLQPGQRVVASGQFLVDSEASLRGLEAKTGAASAPTGGRP
jgi:Cu(I)/Ag(I) efflux system membrane fusion protein